MTKPPLAADASCDIAIVGLAGRFPGARTIEEFWANLESGVDSVSRFTDDELEASGVRREVFTAPGYVRARGIVGDIERFDAAFFGMSAREADILDPQHRLFLECCWQAVEHAGYDFEHDDRRVGVFAGCGISTYMLANLLRHAGLGQAVSPFQIRLGNDRDFLATRISHALNLRGPGITVQTACSTSLVAVHLGCQALLDGECDMVLAGGVTINVPHKAGYLYVEGGIWSNDGCCRPFDARARGTVGGDGAGVVVLKRLADALADGDTVHAVIRGSAVNNDGAMKAGYTAPGVEAQSAVIAEALALAGIHADAIGYVETHGSGTPVGDPIEIEALSRAFGAPPSGSPSCALGSVKANIGHLDHAAGIASLIKTVLMLQHRRLVPLVHFADPNPRIDWAGGRFHVPTASTEWRSGDGAPRRAGVTSLGIGGTNAHVILEEAPASGPAAPSRPWQLLTISARSSTALDAASANLAERLAGDPACPLADVAHTLHVGRRPFSHRRIVLARDAAEAAALLEGRDARGVWSAARADARSVSFLFPGLGDHYAGMGRELYGEEPAFRAHVDRGAELLLPQLGVDLRDVLYGGAPPAVAGDAAGARGSFRAFLGRDDAADPALERLNQTCLAQPAVFVVEYALAQLLMSWGLRPRAMAGYSIGEYVAAALAGVLPFEEAVWLVAERARLIQELPRGAMLAVPLPEAEVRSRLTPGLSISASNGPILTVAAGHEEAVQRLEAELNQSGVASRRLRTTHAFHSAMMDPILDRYLRLVERTHLRPPQIPFASNVTGRWIAGEEATDPAYWVRHLRETVRFGDAAGGLLGEPGQVLLEVGPGESLGALVRQHPGWTGQAVLATLRDRRESRSDVECLLAAVGRTWLEGIPIDWRGFSAAERRRRVPLPSYPFERSRHWIEPQASDAIGAAALDDTTAWIHVPVWRECPPTPPDSTAAAPGRWLLFLDTDGVVARLAGGLRRDGARVACVSAAAAFRARDDLAFEVRADAREDLETLLDRLAGAGFVPDVVVWGWGLGEARPREAPLAMFLRLLNLVQALGARTDASGIEVAVLTSHLCDVLGDEAIFPERAVLLGPCRVAPQEHPHLGCRCIDLAPAAADADALALQVRRELASQPAGPPVAYRGARRWARDYVRLRAGAAPHAAIRRGGTYLITGGAGDTGLQLAEHLAQRHGARLSLVAPPGFPARHQWATWLGSHDPADAVSRRIRRVLALEAGSADIAVIVADVADEEQAAAAVRHTLDRFGALHGVVHAEATAGGGLAQLKTPAMAASVFAPRVTGARALSAAIEGLALDFVVFFSSTTALAGGIGQIDVCAADAFVQAFGAERGARAPYPVTVVHWSPFEWDAWELPGLPALQAELQERLRPSAVPAAAFGDLFDRVLASRVPEAVISPRDFASVVRDTAALTVPRVLASLESEGLPAMHARRESATPYAPPESDTERTIARIWESALGIEPVGRLDNFFELAGNSLLALHIVTRMRQAFDRTVPVTIVFESPTVAALAQRLEAAGGDDEALLREIEAYTPDEVDRRLSAEQGHAPPWNPDSTSGLPR